MADAIDEIKEGLAKDQKPGPDLNPLRLKHDSYDFTDAGNNYQTAYEVADTLEDHFTLARDDKLSDSQQEDFIKFVDDDHVFRVAVIMTPEVARMAGEDYWVTEEDNGIRSPQMAHILHAIAHREPRSRRLSRPAEEETDEQREDLIKRTREIVDGTNADIQATEDAQREATNAPVGEAGTCASSDCGKPAKLRCSKCKNVYYCDKNCQKNDWSRHKDNCMGAPPSTRIQMGEMTTVGDLIRGRQDAGRLSWNQRHSVAA